jgi:hypothetical protein
MEIIVISLLSKSLVIRGLTCRIPFFTLKIHDIPAVPSYHCKVVYNSFVTIGALPSAGISPAYAGANEVRFYHYMNSPSERMSHGVLEWISWIVTCN